ncbi:MAG: tyrosine-protein kinase family protein [Candidatus Hodarchaeales archaeon]|jgi:cellulose biosynthesis protein BcsQ
MNKVLVHSYKGGTGKTTVAVNLASILSHDTKVLLIENDFRMPSFFNIFQHEPEFYFNDYLDGNASFNDTIQCDIKPNLDVIFTNKKFNPAENILGSDQVWFLKLLERMIGDLKALEGEYEHVIFDTPPGWQLILVNLITLADKAILLLRPNSYEVNGTKRLLEILYKRAKPTASLDVYILFNQVPEMDMKVELGRWVKDFQGEGVKYAGKISCSCLISYQMAHETTIFPLEHEFAQSLQLVVKKVL